MVIKKVATRQNIKHSRKGNKTRFNILRPNSKYLSQS